MSFKVSFASPLSPPPRRRPSLFLSPGFRFQPTDEELVSYYLKRKVTNQSMCVDVIAEIDLYKAEPWDLPTMSRLSSRAREWYFFSSTYCRGLSRCCNSRVTSKGYWKICGNDRPVWRGSRIVGTKKTLVFYLGRAPRGERTDWAMHEYRLTEDDELARTGVLQCAYAICKVFQNKGREQQDSARYSGCYIEEDWHGGSREPIRCLSSVIRCAHFIEVDDSLEDRESGIHCEHILPSDASSSVQMTQGGFEDEATSKLDLTNDNFMRNLAALDSYIHKMVFAYHPPPE